MIYVVKDDSNLDNIIKNIKFFTDVEILPIPSWDCVPYDRSSPSKDVLSERIRSLSRISTNNNKKIIVTTANSIIQRTIPKEDLIKNSMIINTGDKWSRDSLINNLIKIGLIRNINAIEPGDFAVRGSIIDICNSNTDQGYR
ncbi:MAG: hypothetical protein EOP45_17125, partial [Sphingobacteriaceae bacterium]